MNHFRTVVSPGSSEHKIDLKHRILTLGSCFADTIGQRLLLNRLPISPNPFGVMYNPLSIHRVIRYAVFNETPATHTFLHRSGIVLNYDFHSELSAESEPALSAKIREVTGSTHYLLAQAEWLIITYGTAWVYERNETGEIAANCHKMPSTLFTKSLLTPEQITTSFESLFRELTEFNPKLKIILTLSPVRHIKDTLEGNSVSKAIVRAACHSITESFTNVDYFPAYEMMMDDLRDYRFYKADMIHPSEVAEDYIWEKFGERYFTPALKNFLTQWQEIQQALHHRPFHPASTSHQSFLKDTLKRLEDLKDVVDVEKEVALIRSQIIEIK